MTAHDAFIGTLAALPQAEGLVICEYVHVHGVIVLDSCLPIENYL
jgi:hypothetical protein